MYQDKARKFETRKADHPQGKLSKKTGEPLMITEYSDDQWKTVYVSSDIITCDGARYLKADLTDAELKALKADKGDDVMREIMKHAHKLAKRIENASKNSGVTLNGDKINATNDFVRVQVAGALDKLLGKKEEQAVKLPF